MKRKKKHKFYDFLVSRKIFFFTFLFGDFCRMNANFLIPFFFFTFLDNTKRREGRKSEKVVVHKLKAHHLG